MRRLLPTLLGCVFTLSAAAQTAFTPGNLVVLQTSGTASKAASTITLREFTTSGTPAMSVTLPTTGPTPLQSAGVYGGSEGFLTTSTDGKYLVLAGYATTTTPSDITSTTSSSIARAAGLVYPSGFYLQFDTSHVFYSANDIRGAISDGANFWASGASNASVDGINYFGPGARVALGTGTSPVKAYGLRIFNGQIYYSTQKAGPANSASQLGIFSIGTGMPTTGPVTTTQIINTGSILPEDFSFNAAGNICYIAINQNNASGGIQKWTKSGSTWSLAYTLGTGIANTGAYGLAVDYSGTFPVIYATTFDNTGNRVIKITDNGSGATATTIVAAASNVYYKGITFAPVASGTPIVNISVSSDTASEAGSSVVTVTANASAPVVGDQTVTLAVSGTGITAGDYILSGTTITIPNGATSGSVTFTVNDDILGEGTETANLTISAPSAGLVLGMRPGQHIVISDNDGNNHPTIVIDTMTVNSIDGGTATAIASPFKLSGVIADPTDPASTYGINLKVKDLETASTSLLVWASSSNTSVVPNTNIAISGSDSIRNVKITPVAVGYSNITIKVTDGIDTTSYIINYAASAASAIPPNTLWHTGMSDASDAIVIDDNYFITGDDELDVLNVYSRSASGLPVKSFDYSSFLSLPNPASPEVDVEASAVSPAYSNRSYWLGSMSNGKSPFPNKPNRDRIFATTYTGTGAATTFSVVGYAALRSSLLSWGDANGYSFSASAADGVDSKSTSGFAAEGMVFGPDNTTLYIGLRAPLVPTATRTKAVIAPILNFETWFNNGAPAGPPTYGSPIELDMSGRGIRDIIRLSNGTYVIIAGSSDATLNGAIYKWSGYPSDAPILVAGSVTSTLNMEGVMQVNTSGTLSVSKLQIICDGGGDVLYADGTEAKDFTDLILRKFRTDMIDGLDLTFPRIAVQGNGLVIADGNTATASADNTDFGSVVYGNATTKQYVIRNNGTAPLAITGITFSGAYAGDYALVTAPVFPLNIAANDTYALTVQFTPQNIGVRTAVLNIANNDTNRGAFDFVIAGNGTCNTLPAFATTGGGAICVGDAGLAISLDSSLTGTNYQLYNGASAVGSAIPGTGHALSFGTHTAAGVYTVVATNALTGCSTSMTDSATIIVHPLPVVDTVIGGGNYCAGGFGVNIGINGSEAGVNYKLYHGATLSATLSGTGSAFSFGSYTTPGIYTVQATNATTGCTIAMNGSAAVAIDLLPSIYAVTGGGSYCAGSAGVHLGLGGSSTGITYSLYNGSTLMSAMAGTGLPLDFGAFTPGGVYTIVATNLTTTCSSNMLGSASINIMPAVTPAVSVTSAPGTTVCAGTAVNFSPVATNGGTVPLYQWYINGTAVASTSTAYSYVPANGDVVSVKLTSNATCVTPDTAMGSVTMTVNPNLTPTAVISASPGTALCAGNPILFTATTTNGGAAPTYMWFRNGILAATSSFFACIPTNGDNVSLTMVSNSACLATDTANSNHLLINVAENYHPIVSIEAVPGTSVPHGTPLTLKAIVTSGGPAPAYQWVKNGTIVSGQTNFTYTSSTFANNDSVSCIVTGTGVCGTQNYSSVKLQVSTLGVQLLSDVGAFTIQPNPNGGEFYIKGSTNEPELTASLTNMLGQIIYEGHMQVSGGLAEKHVVLNNEVPAGIYLLSIRSRSGAVAFRVIVDR